MDRDTKTVDDAIALYDEVVRQAPSLAEDGDSATHFGGYFVHWDIVQRALSDAWPGKTVGYGESPLELVYRLINERDELRAACEMIEGFHGGRMPAIEFQRRYGMQPDRIETLEACLSKLRSALGTPATAPTPATPVEPSGDNHVPDQSL